jgi:hypothetical protein
VSAYSPGPCGVAPGGRRRLGSCRDGWAAPGCRRRRGSTDPRGAEPHSCHARIAATAELAASRCGCTRALSRHGGRGLLRPRAPAEARTYIRCTARGLLPGATGTDVGRGRERPVGAQDADSESRGRGVHGEPEHRATILDSRGERSEWQLFAPPTPPALTAAVTSRSSPPTSGFGDHPA